jgi:hypothetical protein
LGCNKLIEIIEPKIKANDLKALNDKIRANRNEYIDLLNPIGESKDIFYTSD